MKSEQGKCAHEHKNCATSGAGTIRERLEQLVATWRDLAWDGRGDGEHDIADAFDDCADELDAVLRETASPLPDAVRALLKDIHDAVEMPDALRLRILQAVAPVSTPTTDDIAWARKELKTMGIVS